MPRDTSPSRGERRDHEARERHLDDRDGPQITGRVSSERLDRPLSSAIDEHKDRYRSRRFSERNFRDEGRDRWTPSRRDDGSPWSRRSSGERFSRSDRGFRGRDRFGGRRGFYGRRGGRGRGGRRGGFRPESRDRAYDYIIPQSGSYFEHDDRGSAGRFGRSWGEDGNAGFGYGGSFRERRSRADSDSWKHDKFEELEQQGEEVDGQEQEELKQEDSRIFEPTEQENESNNKKPSTSSTSTEEDLSKEEQGIKGEQQPGVSEQDSDKRKDVEPSDRSPKRRRSSS